MRQTEIGRKRSEETCGDMGRRSLSWDQEIRGQRNGVRLRVNRVDTEEENAEDQTPLRKKRQQGCVRWGLEDGLRDGLRDRLPRMRDGQR